MKKSEEHGSFEQSLFPFTFGQVTARCMMTLVVACDTGEATEVRSVTARAWLMRNSAVTRAFRTGNRRDKQGSSQTAVTIAFGLSP